jgi:potassium efflux system protein
MHSRIFPVVFLIYFLTLYTTKILKMRSKRLHAFKIAITGILLLGAFCGFAQTQDSAESQKRRSLFADTNELTSSDYLASIDRANDLMNTVAEEGEFRGRTLRIFSEITNTNNTINLITENVRDASNTNVRNQRMYQRVLTRLDTNLEKYQSVLDGETKKIVELKKKLRTVMRDSVFRKMVRDSILRKQFQSQLQPLRAKFFETDSVLKSNLRILNVHKNENTRKQIVIAEALVTVGDRLDKLGITMFRAERPNLWDTRIKIANQSVSSFIAQKFGVEEKAFSYYFSYSLGWMMLIVLLTALLFWWIRGNIRKLRKAQKLEALELFEFRALNQGILLPMLVVGLNVAVVLNLYAPALYIESLHLALLIALSVLFFKRWHPKTYTRWLLLVAAFVAFAFIDLFLKITLLQRCLFIIVNGVCIRFGLSHLRYIRQELYVKGLFRWANYLFIAFNILAIVFNLFGRVALANTLSLTGIIALTQMIALSVMLRIILEIIILQVYVIRLKRGLTKIFDYEKLEKNAQRPFYLLIIYMWIVVIASNLNLSETLSAFFGDILGRKNSIGSFTFTLGGILLFIVIIWIAHLLQQFVAFFYGGIEEDDEEQITKRQHSKLLITRLFLLVCGYLLAIAASGMPIDKITIILGALGVGVGLGLQQIVSNFVSGVILIFERPIQIGDVIESGNQSGRVKEIGLRTTRIDTANGAEVIIPNAQILLQNIVNWTYSDNYRLVELSFTITGTISQSDTIDTIVASLNTLSELDSEMEPQIFFDSLSVNKSRVKVKFWCNIYRIEQAISEARVALYESFRKRDVDMEH